MTTQTIRAFIAIALPAAVRAELARVGAAWGEQLPPRAVRWVQPDNMHLTLRFLGDTAVAQLPPLSHLLDELAARHSAFRLQLDGVGCFPNRKRPRVLWTGVGGDTAAMQALKKDLDGGLVPLGWERETKPFQAHLTVGRVKDNRAAAGAAWQVGVSPLSWPVTAVHLIESELTRAGPLYTGRHTASLPAP